MRLATVVFMSCLGEASKKSGYFTVRLTVRRGGGSALSALTVSKCENFDPFFSMEYDSMILKAHFISL